MADIFNGVFDSLNEELAVTAYAIMYLIAPDDTCQPLCFLSRFLVFGALLWLQALPECLLEIVTATFADEVLNL